MRVFQKNIVRTKFDIYVIIIALQFTWIIIKKYNPINFKLALKLLFFVHPQWHMYVMFDSWCQHGEYEIFPICHLPLPISPSPTHSHRETIFLINGYETSFPYSFQCCGWMCSCFGLTDFVCLYNYEFWFFLCKIARSSVIFLLPLFKIRFTVSFTCALISIHLNNTVANTHLKPVLMQSIKQPDQQ
jgi:hypothetical protein